MNPTHKMMLTHVKSLVEAYVPAVEEWNKSVVANDTKFAQWLEGIERAPLSPDAIALETNVRSLASVEEMAALHDFAKSLVKITQDLLTTKQFVANHSEDDEDSTANETVARLLESFGEISTLFDAMRKLDIPADTMAEFLPIRMAKAPRNGALIPKLAIDRPKSERKQIRANSTHTKLVVDGVMMDEAFGEAITKAFRKTMQEFLADLTAQHKMTVYDLADGAEVEMYGKTVTALQR